jgi:hypothetical protein
MDINEWEEKYKPITNPFDEHASLGGVMFETYGKELEFVRAQTNKHIWTYQDGDEGSLIITSGFRLIDRIGYVVTEIPWEEYEEVELN